MVFLFPEAIAVELSARQLVEIDEGHALCGSDVGGPLCLWLADDKPPFVTGITRRERHQDGVGTCLANVTDIAAQVMTVTIHGVGYLFALVETYDHRVFCHPVDDAACAFDIEEVRLVVMTDADDYPVTWLQGLTDGRPEIGVEVTG